MWSVSLGCGLWAVGCRMRAAGCRVRNAGWGCGRAVGVRESNVDVDVDVDGAVDLREVRTRTQRGCRASGGVRRAR